MVVEVAKEVFSRTDDKFAQRITYSVGDSNELIRQFRNDVDFPHRRHGHAGRDRHGRAAF